eukprot:351077-Chlamydomonas_euryale.AAC.3
MVEAPQLVLPLSVPLPLVLILPATHRVYRRLILASRPSGSLLPDDDGLPILRIQQQRGGSGLASTASWAEKGHAAQVTQVTVAAQPLEGRGRLACRPGCIILKVSRLVRTVEREARVSCDAVEQRSHQESRREQEASCSVGGSKVRPNGDWLGCARAE